MLLHKLPASLQPLSISDCIMEQAQQQYRLALKTCWLRKPCLALPAVYPKGSNVPAAGATGVSPKPLPPSVFLLLANPATEVRQVIFFFCFLVQLRLLSCREQQVSMGTAVTLRCRTTVLAAERSSLPLPGPNSAFLSASPAPLTRAWKWAQETGI